ncbi:unnamed protein product [Staurois parvus]|uniref:Small EDRK-rich factor-like N-terminal domain-containing protein n=1 Tax=Staurois parvus TaxID=386267 RepID=A0ABN9CUQ8_9NEOB|nr:unnamed protein product [Staurois parvus]
MEPAGRKEKSKPKESVSRLEKAKQKSAQQELKQRQRAEVPARHSLPVRLRPPSYYTQLCYRCCVRHLTTPTSLSAFLLHPSFSCHFLCPPSYYTHISVRLISCHIL